MKTAQNVNQNKKRKEYRSKNNILLMKIKRIIKDKFFNNIFNKIVIMINRRKGINKGIKSLIRYIEILNIINLLKKLVSK